MIEDREIELERWRNYELSQRFLGREFLTWLLVRVKDGRDLIEWDLNTCKIVIGGKIEIFGGNGSVMKFDGQYFFDRQFWEYIGEGYAVDKMQIDVLNAEENLLAEMMLTSESLVPRSMKIVTSADHAGFEEKQEQRIESYRSIRNMLSHAFDEFMESRSVLREMIWAVCDGQK